MASALIYRKHGSTNGENVSHLVGRTFWRFGREHGVEVERLVGGDRRLEGRRDFLLQELLPVDGREERVAHQLVDAIGTLKKRNIVTTNKS